MQEGNVTLLIYAFLLDQFGQDWRLQQDNDPSHELLDWSSNSPNVIPIENIWAIVKRNVEKKKPVNIDEFELCF